MKSSDQLGELFAALAKAQAEIEGAVKDSKNDFYKSNYADLAAVWDACRVPLSKNQLSVVQLPDSDDPNILALTTVLGHSSGQWISSRLVMTPAQLTPQGVISALTYARRGALSAIAGVSPEDDDGNTASGVNAGPKYPPPAKTPAPKELPDYTAAQFAKNRDAWEALIRDGNKTGAEIIALVETRAKLGPAQKEIIMGFSRAISAEVNEFIAEMEAAE